MEQTEPQSLDSKGSTRSFSTGTLDYIPSTEDILENCSRAGILFSATLLTTDPARMQIEFREYKTNDV
jgi:hypothetical protein